MGGSLCDRSRVRPIERRGTAPPRRRQEEALHQSRQLANRTAVTRRYAHGGTQELELAGRGGGTIADEAERFGIDLCWIARRQLNAGSDGTDGTGQIVA